MLDVFANVEIEFGTGTGRGRLVAVGQDFDLDVDEPSTLIGVVDRQALGRLAETLTRFGLNLRVRSGDRLLLSAGRDTEPGNLGRLLGLPGVRLSPRLALRLALGRGRPRS